MFQFMVDSVVVDPLSKVLPIGEPIITVIMVILILTKYNAAAFQPFVRNIYVFMTIASICKVTFSWIHPNVDARHDLVASVLQDCSMIFAVGSVMTMALDFLWALSTTMETGSLFHRDVSEAEFVSWWTKVEVVLCVILGLLHHVPQPLNSELVFQGAVACCVTSCFMFLWFCLWKVRGTSRSERFKAAYNSAFNTNAIINVILVIYLMAVGSLFEDPEKNLVPFLIVEHAAETVGMFIIVSYFMYLKAPPSDLREHVHSAGSVATVLRAKEKFKGLLKKKKGNQEPLLAGSA